MQMNSTILTKKHSQSFLLPTVDDIYFQYQSMKASIDNVDQENIYNLGILLLKIMALCYKSKENQVYLCRILNLPYKQGAITLNSIPNKMKLSGNELFKLFQHIKSVKQNYFCWIIYFNQQLQIWSVKLIQEFEIQQNLDLFNPLQNLLGIFIGRHKDKGILEKPKVKSKAISKKNLEGIRQAQIKNKSISMKQPKFKKMSAKLGLSNSTTNSTIYSKHNSRKREEKISKAHSNILSKTQNKDIKIDKLNENEYQLIQISKQEMKQLKISIQKSKQFPKEQCKAKQIPIHYKSQKKLSEFKKKPVIYPDLQVKPKLTIKKLEQNKAKPK